MPAVQNWVTLAELDALVFRGFEVQAVEWRVDPPRAIVELRCPDDVLIVTYRSLAADQVPRRERACSCQKPWLATRCASCPFLLAMPGRRAR